MITSCLLPVVWDEYHVARRSCRFDLTGNSPRTGNKQDPGIFGGFSSVIWDVFFLKTVKFSQFLQRDGTIEIFQVAIGMWPLHPVQPGLLITRRSFEAKLAARQEFSSLPPAIRCLLDVETNKKILKGKTLWGWIFGDFFLVGGGLTKKEIAHFFQVCPFAKK